MQIRQITAWINLALPVAALAFCLDCGFVCSKHNEQSNLSTAVQHSFSILSEHPVLWVDPISTDECLRNELRGLYYTKRRYVENDAGNRFLYDAYGVKWLAFDPRSQM